VQDSVKVLNETLHRTTNATNWVDLPGAATTVLIHANHRDLFIVRFFGESACFGGVGNQFCKVRIMIDGVEANPAIGAEFAFDSTDNGAESNYSWEAHAMERSRCVVAGADNRLVPVKVQWAVSDPATTHREDDWHLTIVRSHNCD
jgi:hypothetical protein